MGGVKNKARYTITNIAKELGITRQTIYYWIKKNWVTPKRDYRDYPVFSGRDLASIKKWYSTLSEGMTLIKKKKARRKPRAGPALAAHHLTWEEIQKALYK